MDKVGQDSLSNTDATASAPMPARRTGQAPSGARGGHERDGTDDPIRELRYKAMREDGAPSDAPTPHGPRGNMTSRAFNSRSARQLSKSRYQPQEITMANP